MLALAAVAAAAAYLVRRALRPGRGGCGSPASAPTLFVKLEIRRR